MHTQPSRPAVALTRENHTPHLPSSGLVGSADGEAGWCLFTLGPATLVCVDGLRLARASSPFLICVCEISVERSTMFLVQFAACRWSLITIPGQREPTVSLPTEREPSKEPYSTTFRDTLPPHCSLYSRRVGGLRNQGNQGWRPSPRV